MGHFKGCGSEIFSDLHIYNFPADAHVGSSLAYCFGCRGKIEFDWKNHVATFPQLYLIIDHSAAGKLFLFDTGKNVSVV